MPPLYDQWNVEQEVSSGSKTYDQVMSACIFLIVELSPFIVMCTYIL